MTPTWLTLLVLMLGLRLAPHLGLDRLRDNVLARRDCRRLRPLWLAVVDTVPQIALLPHPAEPRLERVRLTVEILDGYVLLAPWMSARTELRARRHAACDTSGRSDPEPAVAAAMLAAAIVGKRLGAPPADEPVPVTALVDPGDLPDAAAQVRWLARIAAAMNRSPVVLDTLAELRPVTRPECARRARFPLGRVAAAGYRRRTAGRRGFPGHAE